MKPHRTDGVSLSFGLIFLAIVVWWAVSQVVDLRLPALGWLAAGGLILFGVLGLLGAIRSGRTGEQEPVQAEPVQAEPVQAEPVQAEPVQAEPVQAEAPVDSPPADADHTDRTREFPPYPPR